MLNGLWPLTNARREARKAALEEAAQLAENVKPWGLNNQQRHAVDLLKRHIAKAIREAAK